MKTNVNDISKIRAYLEKLFFLEYAIQMRRSETPSTPMGAPQMHKGKKKAIWGLNRSTLGSDSSFSWGSNYVVNELSMYLQMDSIEVPDDDNGFEHFAWCKACESKFHVLFVGSYTPLR